MKILIDSFVRIKIAMAVEPEEVDVVDMKSDKPVKKEAEKSTPRRKRSSRKSKSVEAATETVQKDVCEKDKGDRVSGEGSEGATKILMVRTENLEHSSFEKTRELKV